MASVFDTPLLELAACADKIKQSMWGTKVFYVKNMHINFTNICTNMCKFCAFYKKADEEGAYLLKIDDIVDKVRKEGKDTLELHIVGSLHPDVDINYYTDLLSTLKSEFPEKTLKAFGAVEMEHMSRISGVPLRKLMQKLKAAGLEMMPGGGAEIFAPHIREQICPEKITGEKWLEVMETAHDEGIKTNATMLYGHLESGKDRESHLLALRKLQEKTKGFNAFIPLAFHPLNTKFADITKATAVDDLYVTAASRVILDNFPHIKAYWVMLGEKTAQVALNFGADDLDGTIVQENITFAAGGISKRTMTETELQKLIVSAGMVPVERDSFYNIIKVHNGN